MSPIPGLNEPYPFRDALVDSDGYATPEFDRWLQQHLIPTIDSAPTQITVVADDDLNDAVALSELSPSAAGGFYRVSPFVQIITPDGVSSSAQVQLQWEFNAQSLTKTFSNVNGNTATTVSSDAPFTFRASPGTPITYTVTYASNTPNAMVYSLTISLELMRVVS